MAIRSSDRRQAAEILALGALSWLAREPERLGRFLVGTGLGPAALKHHAQDPELLAAVLDFLLADEGMLREFCDAASHPYTAPRDARAALPGGAEPHWT